VQIFIDCETPLLPCLLSDVSETGARIKLEEVQFSADRP
jgi:hypothetical protein